MPKSTSMPAPAPAPKRSGAETFPTPTSTSEYPDGGEVGRRMEPDAKRFWVSSAEGGLSAQGADLREWDNEDPGHGEREEMEPVRNDAPFKNLSSGR